MEIKNSGAIEIDREKCTKCLLCVQDCVSGVFRIKENRPQALYPDLCNRCSHCMAVCPAGAINHFALDACQARPLEKGKIDPQAYAEIVRGRRSIRRYKKEPPPKELVEKILDLARYSPTASNDQNVSYFVLTDPALLQHISTSIFGLGKRLYRFFNTAAGKAAAACLGLNSRGGRLKGYIDSLEYYDQESKKGRDFILYGAPYLILLAGPKGSTFARDNCCLAAANITNYAYALGLGTCHIGFVTLGMRFLPGLKKNAGVPKNLRVHASVALGRPAIKHNRLTSRKPPQIHWR